MAVWDVRFKLALKSDSWTGGKLGVDGDDEQIERKIWCLESFIRQRRNPKQPIIHCQFGNNKIQQIQPGIVRYNTSQDLVIEFSGYGDLEQFEGTLITVRKSFLDVVQQKVDALAARKKESFVARYKEILKAIQNAREDFEEKRRQARAEQIEMARQAVLESSQDIQDSYHVLVEREKSITKELFWARYDAKVKAMVPLPTLDEPFFDFTATVEDDAKLAALLIESPYISERYKTLVEGGKLNQKEFWHRLFRSRYFAQLIGNPLPPSESVDLQEDSYFNAPEERHIQPDLALSASELVPPDLDIISTIPEKPNKRDEDESFVQAELKSGGTAVSPPSKALHLQQGYQFSDRLNNLADRSLNKRIQQSCYFSSPTENASNNLQRLYDTGDESQLATIASLMSLEASLSGMKNTPTVNVREQVARLRKRRLENSTRLIDLDASEDATITGFSDISRKETVHLSGGITAAAKMPPASRIDRGVYASKLRAAITDYKAQLDVRLSGDRVFLQITSNETVTKCAYVKFTKILSNTTNTTKQQQLAELLKNETVLRYVEEVALLQNKVSELIHFVYDEKLKTDPTSLRQHLRQLQSQVETLMRHEIDTNGGGVMNSRTLCRPILYELEQAHKALG